MSALLAWALAAACAAGLEAEVLLSPDQPLPYGYVDDPVVVSIVSPADAQVAARLTVELPGGAPVTLEAPALVLRAGAPGLVAFNGLPAQRGLFKGTLTLRAAAEELTREALIARIERPAAASLLPVCIHSIETIEQIHAARAATAQCVRVDIARPNLPELIRAAAPLPVVLAVSAAQRGDLPGLLATLPEALAPAIGRWSVDPEGDIAALREISELVRASAFKAPLELSVPDAATFERLLAEGAAELVHSTVLVSDVTTGKEARLLLDAAERAGFEDWPLHVMTTGASQGAPLALQQVLANLAAGAAGTGLHAGLLYDGAAMGPAFVPLNALGRRLIATAHAGNASLGTAVSAPLFRDGARWLLAVWTEGPEKSVEVPVAGAEQLQLTDPAGNTLSLPAIEKDALKITVGALPVFLSGSGGPVLGVAARAKAQNAARRMLEDAAVARWMAPELRGLVQAVIDRKGELDRSATLALMRAIPEYERQWHAGKLPRAVAVPAIADLSRLCRLLATVDQDTGQDYLEPMHDMIARSEELQSIYLTGSGGGAAAHVRGDWVLREVRRLIDEARALVEAGRRTEAAGVAALAEWRARGLEFAALEGDKSRLSEGEILALAPGTAPAAPAPAPAPGEAEAPAGKAPEAPKAEAKAETKAEVKPAPKADEKLAPGQPKGTRKVMHTVKRGETPESIAKQYGADFETFRTANGLRRGAALKAGRQYTVYVPVKAEPQEEPEKKEAAAPAEDAKSAASDAGQPANTRKVVHKVVKGDNPSVIASKYGVKLDDFLKWNKLTKKARFQIGEEYVVYAPVKR